MVPRSEHDRRPAFDPLRTLRFFAFGFGMGKHENLMMTNEDNELPRLQDL